jgi:hypothetical protein
VDHLLFSSPLAEFIWVFLGETLWWKGHPKNMQDLLDNWLTGGFGVNYQTGLSCFAGFALALWTVRNKMCIQKSFPERPLDVVHLGISFV